MEQHLDVLHAFGLEGGQADGQGAPAGAQVSFVSESQVLWPVGAHLAVHDLRTKAMSFVPLSDGADSVSATALAASRRILAVCECVPRGGGSGKAAGQVARVSIYKIGDATAGGGFKRVKQLSHHAAGGGGGGMSGGGGVGAGGEGALPDAVAAPPPGEGELGAGERRSSSAGAGPPGSGTFVAAAFSADGQHLACLVEAGGGGARGGAGGGGSRASSCTLVVWDWARGKRIAMAATPPHAAAVSFCPTNGNVLATSTHPPPPSTHRPPAAAVATSAAAVAVAGALPDAGAARRAADDAGVGTIVQLWTLPCEENGNVFAPSPPLFSGLPPASTSAGDTPGSAAHPSLGAAARGSDAAAAAAAGARAASEAGAEGSSHVAAVHCWTAVGGRLAVATAAGDLFIFADRELAQSFPQLQAAWDSNGEDLALSSVAPFSGGLVASGRGGRLTVLMHKGAGVVGSDPAHADPSDAALAVVRTVALSSLARDPGPLRLLSKDDGAGSGGIAAAATSAFAQGGARRTLWRVAVSPSGREVLCCFEGTVGLVSLAAALGDDEANAAAGRGGRRPSLAATAEVQLSHPFPRGFHAGAIGGMSLCASEARPMLVTCSDAPGDCSVRVWPARGFGGSVTAANAAAATAGGTGALSIGEEEDDADSLTSAANPAATLQCTLLERFGASIDSVGGGGGSAAEPVSVSLHPSGLYLLVGFRNRACLYHLLLAELRVAGEFLRRGAGPVAFSRGGNLFAVASGKEVMLFATFGDGGSLGGAEGGGAAAAAAGGAAAAAAAAAGGGGASAGGAAGAAGSVVLGNFERVGACHGHQHNVVTLAWAPGDLGLVTAATDGAVYEWSVEALRRSAIAKAAAARNPVAAAAAARAASAAAASGAGGSGAVAASSGRCRELVRKGVRYARLATAGDGIVAAACSTPVAFDVVAPTAGGAASAGGADGKGGGGGAGAGGSSWESGLRGGGGGAGAARRGGGQRRRERRDVHVVSCFSDHVDGNALALRLPRGASATSLLFAPGASTSKAAFGSAGRGSGVGDDTALFVGASTGHVYVFAWPPTPGDDADGTAAALRCLTPLASLALHRGAVSGMVLSANRCLLYTAGDDGALFVCRRRATTVVVSARHTRGTAAVLAGMAPPPTLALASAAAPDSEPLGTVALGGVSAANHEATDALMWASMAVARRASVQPQPLMAAGGAGAGADGGGGGGGKRQRGAANKRGERSAGAAAAAAAVADAAAAAIAAAEADGGAPHSAAAAAAESSAADPLVLLPASTVGQFSSKVGELSSELVEARVLGQYALDAERRAHADTLEHLEADATEDRQSAQQRESELERALAELAERTREDEEAKERAHMAAASELESLYEAKLAHEAARYLELRRAYDDLAISVEERLLAVSTEARVALRETRTAAEQEIAAEQQEVERVGVYSEYVKEQYDEVLRQTEDEQTTALMQLSASVTAESRKVGEAKAAAKGERKLLLRSVDEVQRSLAERDSELGVAATEAKRAAEAIAKQKRDSAALRKQLLEEQARTREWKQTATSHVHKGRELERMRQVLAARIRELETEARPREQQLAELQEQVREMNDEHERTARAQTALDAAIADKNAKTLALSAEARSLSKQLAEAVADADVLQRGLGEVVAQRTALHAKDWKKAVLALHERHCGEGSRALKRRRAVGAENANDPAAVGELLRQKASLAKALLTMQESKAQGEQRGARAEAQLRREGSVVLAQLNELRQERHDLKHQCRELEAEVGRLRLKDDSADGGVATAAGGGARAVAALASASAAPALLDTRRQQELPRPSTSNAGGAEAGRALLARLNPAAAASPSGSGSSMFMRPSTAGAPSPGATGGGRPGGRPGTSGGFGRGLSGAPNGSRGGRLQRGLPLATSHTSLQAQNAARRCTVLEGRVDELSHENALARREAEALRAQLREQEAVHKADMRRTQQTAPQQPLSAGGVVVQTGPEAFAGSPLGRAGPSGFGTLGATGEGISALAVDVNVVGSA